MNIKKLLSPILLSLLTSIFLCVMPSIAQQGPEGFPFELSEEDVQNLAQELDQFFNSLTPEQQKEFMQEVERETEKMNGMSPEELDSYVQKTLFEEQPEEEPAVIIPEPEPQIEDEPEQKDPAIIKTSLKKEFTQADIASAVKLLEDLIENLDTFLLKTEVIPNFSGKVSAWIKSGKLRSWSDDASWTPLKVKIELLKKKSYTLKDQDIKTKIYKHIIHLLEQEDLYKNIRKLHADLHYYNRRIRIPTDAQKKLSQTSKESIRMILNSLANTLFDETILDSIEKVIKQFDLQAQKIAQRKRSSSKG